MVTETKAERASARIKLVGAVANLSADYTTMLYGGYVASLVSIHRVHFEGALINFSAYGHCCLSGQLIAVWI